MVKKEKFWEKLAVRFFPQQIHEYNQGKLSRLISLEENLKNLKKKCVKKNFEEKIIDFTQETDFIHNLKVHFLLVSIKPEYHSKFTQEFEKTQSVYLECLFNLTTSDNDTFFEHIEDVIRQVHNMDKVVVAGQIKLNNETNI